MRNTIYIFSILLGVAISNNAVSQDIYPLNFDLNKTIERVCNSLDSEVHTSMKPYIKGNLEIKYDTLLISHRTKTASTWFHRKLRYENFIIVDTTDFYLTIDPLINVELSKEKDLNTNLYRNTRGFIVKGNIGKNVSFYSSFYENQGVFSTYRASYIRKTGIVPGQGLIKGFKDSGYDFAWASGMLSYSAKKYFNFQFGHGKNFIGDGYRSLILSDNSFNYPHLKITTNIWKFQYTNIFASLVDMNNRYQTTGAGSRFGKKGATFHLLSTRIGKRLEIAFFESIIWRAEDTSEYRGFDLNYFNPVIFYRPVEFSLNSADNALVGSNVKFKLNNRYSIYGQLVIDDLDIAGMKKGKGYTLNKYSFQLGIQAFNLVGIKNLFVLSEYNQVQPYMYAHKIPNQNYSHYSQALAHPLGANFTESVTIIKYQIKDIGLRLQVNSSYYGADTMASHWGSNIFKTDYDAQLGFPEFGNEIHQGVKTNLLYVDAELSYLINPQTNLKLVAGGIYREVTNSLSSLKNVYVYFGLRTTLTNQYWDF